MKTNSNTPYKPNNMEVIFEEVIDNFSEIRTLRIRNAILNKELRLTKLKLQERDKQLELHSEVMIEMENNCKRNDFLYPLDIKKINLN